MGQAAYNTEIYKADTSTATVGEAFEVITGTSNLKFKVTNNSKAIIDPSVTPTFYEDGVLISTSDITKIYYYIGVVEFATAKTGVITADYNYYTLTEICFLNSVSLSFDFGVTENTTLCSTDQGYRKKTRTLQSLSATHDGFYDENDNYMSEELINDTDSYIVRHKLGNVYKFDVVYKLKIASTDIGADVQGLITSSTSLESDGEGYVDIF